MKSCRLLLGDCVELIQKIATASIHFSIFSPPFAELYVYSDDHRDMGNARNYREFLQHFRFLIPELSRVLMPGRIICVHCMDLPIQKGKEGYLGVRDFPGMLVREFERHGFIYDGRTTIWKNPVTEMQRTKAIGLLNKQKDKDASISRFGLADYILKFKNAGENLTPIVHNSIDNTHPNYLPISEWQKYASPVWMDIDYGNTLNKEGRENGDEKHIAPLQLDTIKRCIHLWSNPDEIIFTPFLGIGSEVYQALKMNRRGIGIELKKSYFDIAKINCSNIIAERNQLSLV